MLAQAHFPHSLDPAQLDRYLEKGWFRMGQTIFTTNFLNFNHQLYSALWLRIDLRKFEVSSRQRKLIKTNSRFRCAVQQASIDPLKELLYARYKQCVSFETSSSLRQLMFGSSAHNIYSTVEISMYDDGKLIATGFFDLGDRSAAGITSFYDPDYKKYSLGKHLIYQKIVHCQERGMEFFYPGYFASGYPFFDYKLEIGGSALEYLDLCSGRWLPISEFSADNAPIQLMYDNLFVLQKCLSADGIHSELLKYEYFDAGILIDSDKANLFDYPIFISCADVVDEAIIPVVYDVRDRRFHLIRCSSLWLSSSANELPGVYSSRLLRMEEVVFSTTKAEEISQALATRVKKNIKTSTFYRS